MSWHVLAWRLRLLLGPRAVAASSVLALVTFAIFARSGPAGRIVVVGDVHGCADELEDLLEAITFDSTQDDLVFVGDLIGKGPAPKAVVRTARRLGALAAHEWFEAWQKRPRSVQAGISASSF
eukprot:s874_g18.t1